MLYVKANLKKGDVNPERWEDDEEVVADFMWSV